MRLIDADELNKAMFHGVAEIVPEDEHSPESYKRGWNDALEAVADKSCTPTIDAVEVVRCKDCKYMGEVSLTHNGDYIVNSCGYHNSFVNKNDYCSRAERRTDAVE